MAQPTKEKTDLLRISQQMKETHTEVNLRYNISLNTQGLQTKKKQQLRPETLLKSYLRKTVSKATSLATLESDLSFTLLAYLIEELESNDSRAFLTALPKQFARANKKITTDLPSDMPKVKPGSLENLDTKDARAMLLQSREGLGIVQYLIDSQDQRELQFLIKLVIDDMEYFIMHKLGIYIFQKMLPLDSTLRKETVNLCCEQFNQLVCHEFASRVMQLLVESTPDFRSHVLANFKLQKNLWLRHIAALFVLSSCMKHSPQEGDYGFVYDYLLSDIDLLMQSKFKKRALVSLIEESSLSSLSKIFELLYSGRNWEEDLEDKYLTYITIAFVRVNYRPMIDKLANSLRIHLGHLMNRCYFKLLMNKILLSDPPEVLNKLNSSLSATNMQDLVHLCRNRKSRDFYYYVFLVVSSVTDEPRSISTFKGFSYELAQQPFVRSFDPQLSRLLDEVSN